MKFTDKFEFIKGKPARNRLGLPPMDTLMAEDGFANEFHIQHYGSKAYGGLGTIIIESTAVSEEGKIRSKDLGLWKDEQVKPMASLAKVIKMGGALAGVQLNHAGSKAEMDDIDKIGTTMFYDYLPQERLSIITPAQIKEIEDKFIKAAFRAKEAGFDFVEVHGAHGYLLNQLMHPQLNEVIKSDDILVRGEAVINIVRRIHDEVKIPVGLRLSVTDNEPTGLNVEDYEPIIKKASSFVNYFNVSSGEAISHENIVNAIKAAGTPIYRIPLAKKVKEYTDKPVMIAGNVSSKQNIEEIMAAGIDGVLIGRESIFTPNLTWHLLDVEDMDKDVYHWNKNIWFNPHDYLDLMKKMGLK